MQFRPLGTTDIQVSTVAMGCWAIVGDFTWGKQDETDAVAAMHAARDTGINFFDTAEAYGEGYSEELLGKVFGRGDEIVIASKASPDHFRRGDLIAACEASLRRLRRDWIDLYQLHWPNREVPVAETIAALGTLVRQGKVRAVGVSNFGVQDLGEYLAEGTCATNQLAYSLLFRAIEYEIQPLCAAHDVGILCYSPLAQGLLTGKFAAADDVPPTRARTRHFSGDREHCRHGEAGCEAATFAALADIRAICASLGKSMADVALAWALAQPSVTAVLAGARNAAQVRENAAAADLELGADTLAALAAATASVKEELGTNPDAWVGGDSGRMR